MDKNEKMALMTKLCVAFVREHVYANLHVFGDKLNPFEGEAKAVVDRMQADILARVTAEYVAKEHKRTSSFRGDMMLGCVGTSEEENELELPDPVLRNIEECPELASAVTAVFGRKVRELSGSELMLVFTLASYGLRPLTEFVPPCMAYQELVKRHGFEYICKQLKTAIVLLPNTTRKGLLPILSVANDESLLENLSGPDGNRLTEGSVDHALWRIVLRRFEELTMRRATKVDAMSDAFIAKVKQWWDITWPAKPDLIRHPEDLDFFLDTALRLANDHYFDQFCTEVAVPDRSLPSEVIAVSE